MKRKFEGEPKTLHDLLVGINQSSCFCKPGEEESRVVCTGCEPVVKKWVQEVDIEDEEALFTGKKGLFKNARLLMLVMRHSPSFIPEGLLREYLPQMIVDHRKLNFCITGQAGCGKSYIIGKLTELMNEVGLKYVLAAPTGTAAININGSTLHSVFGFMPKDPETYLNSPKFFSKNFKARLTDKKSRRAVLNKQILTRWQKLEVLVCDEVSMVSKNVLSMIDNIARHIRKKPSTPFGGIQIVFAGDFLQLPPIQPRGQEVTFLFEDPLWKYIHCVALLTENQRQDDEAYQKMLAGIRVGSVTIETMNLLRSRTVSKIPEYTKGVDWNSPDQVLKIPVMLVGTNEEVDKYNMEASKENFNELKTFKPRIQWYQYNEHNSHRANADSESTVKFDETKIKLCPPNEAPSLHEVMSFLTDTTVERMSDQQFKEGSLCEYTVNKLEDKISNGTLFVVTGIKESRAVGLPWHPVGVMENQVEIDVAPVRHTQWVPSVKKFIAIDYCPFKEVYAMTIHRAQGKTLSKVFIDMKRIFTSGHGYIALSRSKTLDGMTICNFDPSKIKADPKALTFYEKLK